MEALLKAHLFPPFDGLQLNLLHNHLAHCQGQRLAVPLDALHRLRGYDGLSEWTPCATHHMQYQEPLFTAADSQEEK